MIFQIKKLLDYNCLEPYYYYDHKYLQIIQVRFYNWLEIDSDFFLLRVINKRYIMKKTPDKTISIFYVFGYRLNIDIDRSDNKIFYSGKNVHAGGFPYSGKYDDDLEKKIKKIVS